jgi:hypothetical protein
MQRGLPQLEDPVENPHRQCTRREARAWVDFDGALPHLNAAWPFSRRGA